MLRKLPFSERILGRPRGPAQHGEEEQPTTPQHAQPPQKHHGTPPPRRPEPQIAGGEALPFGWELAVSRSTGEQYFVNTATGESTFTLPDFTVGEQLEQCGLTFRTPIPSPAGCRPPAAAGCSWLLRRA